MFAALVLVALAIRVVAVLATPAYMPRHDDADYDRIACDVARHGFVSRIPAPLVGPSSCSPLRPRGLQPTAYRPPLWPLALGAAYAVAEPLHADRFTVGRLLQAVIGTAAVALMALIALELCGWRVALLALGLGAVFLPLVLTGLSLVSEPLFLALLLGSVLSVLQARRAARPLPWALVAGVLIGLASLTRANGPLLALPLMAGVWPRGVRAPLALALAAALTVAPWTIRNAVVVHAFVPVSTSAGNTLLGTYNATSRSTHGCHGCWIVLGRYRRWLPYYARLRALPEAERDRRYRATAFAYIRRHPGYPVEVLALNSLRLLELGGSGRTRFTADTIDVPGLAAVWGARELWLVLALALFALAKGRLRRAPAFLVALVALLWVTTALIQSETPRFRAPIDPFLVIAAAAGLAMARPSRSARRPGSPTPSTTRRSS